MYDEPGMIRAGQAIDDRGVLVFCNDFHLAGVVRFYAITNHRRGLVRAWHGHAKSDTYLWPILGSWMVAAARIGTEQPKIDRHALDRQTIYHVPAGWYHGHQNLTDGAILGVFSTASIEEIREDDTRLLWDRWPEVWSEVQR